MHNDHILVGKRVDEGIFAEENRSEVCNEPYNNYTIQARCGLCSIEGNRYNVIYTFGIGSLFAAIIRIVILLFKFASYSRQLKTLWSFVIDFQYWVEIPMLVFSILFVSVFRRSCLCPVKWQWEVGTIAILLVWFDLIIFIRNLQLFDIGN